MRNAFFAMVFSGVLVLAVVGCGSSDSSDSRDGGAGGAGGGGGGGEAITKVCDKLKVCGILTDVTSCTALGKEKMGSATSDQVAAIDQCLAKECTEFLTCIMPYQFL
jgi:hypothetical protein